MDEDQTPLTQVERLALADRNSKGQFVKGHRKSSPGRPIGVLNKITKTLREEVREGLGDVPTFIRELKRDYPPAAAGLLAKLMPAADAEVDPEAGRVISVTITPIQSGTWLPPLEIERRPDPRPPGLRLVGGVDATDEPPDPAA